VTLTTTVAVAPVIDPQRLGYFNYVYWLGSTTGIVGFLGIPMMTSKYMAEFLGAGSRPDNLHKIKKLLPESDLSGYPLDSPGHNT
jgi:O-antigen/teichoic acid export membrane protein